MKPRPLGVAAAAAAAADVLVGAGPSGWAWRPRPGARTRGVRVGGASNPHAAAAACAPVHSERHHGGVRLRPFGLPGMGNDDPDVEAWIEKVIYACRFMTFLAIAGSLAGSVPCFLKGCIYVMDAFMEYYLHGGGKVILMLVEAIDMYLIGTVMFVFGTGLYELFISNMDIAKQSSYGSNLFGLFRLPERPKWLEIQSVNDLKTKLGHVIVMVLLGVSTYSPGSLAPREEARSCLVNKLNLQNPGAYNHHRLQVIYSCPDFSTAFFMQFSVPADARRLEARAPIISMHRPCFERGILEVPVEQVDSTPGHSPSIGHNTPPN